MNRILQLTPADDQLTARLLYGNSARGTAEIVAFIRESRHVAERE